MPLTHYRTLGHSGLRVSPLCLGAMTFGEQWGFGADEAGSLRQLDLYAERGGNFIDAATSTPRATPSGSSASGSRPAASRAATAP